jgi:hypothetical protein
MSQHLTEKWAPILDHADLPQIADPYRKAVTAQLLENQEKFLQEQAAVGVSSSGLLTEDLTNQVGTDGYQSAAAEVGPRAGFDPVLISMIRRAMPNLIAYDICGVQPMSGPTGLIFAMRAMYDGQFGPNEALFNEADPTFSNTGGEFGYTAGQPYTYPNGQTTAQVMGNPQYPYVPGQTPYSAAPTSTGGEGTGAAVPADPGFLMTQGSTAGSATDNTSNTTGANTSAPPGGLDYNPILGENKQTINGQATANIGMGGMNKGTLEQLGTTGKEFRQMGFSIEKAIVEAKGRALKAQYTIELAQDLRAIHGLDAEAELANILSSEILAEINREVVRTVYRTAVPGAQNNVTTPGTFNLDTDSNGRWSVEKFKGLLFQIERDCNAIAELTRRGKGNLIVCSADVASALTMAGVLDYTPALNANLNVDDTGNLFAGTINGKLKVFIDPYSANVSNTQYYVAGYKGTNAYDAGIFYCPYVPLQMVRSVTADTFQPNIGFKTRYGLIANPYAEGPIGGIDANQGLGRLSDNTNRYYRRVRIENLM